MPRPLSSAARQVADEESMALPLDMCSEPRLRLGVL